MFAKESFEDFSSMYAFIFKQKNISQDALEPRSTSEGSAELNNSTVIDDENKS